MKKISFYLMLFVACISMNTANAQFNNPVNEVWTSPSYYQPEHYSVQGNSPYWLVDPEKYVIEINVPGAKSITVWINLEITVMDPYFDEGYAYVIAENPWTVVEVGNYVTTQTSYSPSWNWKDYTYTTFTIANGSKLSLNLELLGYGQAECYYDIEYQANY